MTLPSYRHSAVPPALCFPVPPDARITHFHAPFTMRHSNRHLRATIPCNSSDGLWVTSTRLKRAQSDRRCYAQNVATTRYPGSVTQIRHHLATVTYPQRQRLRRWKKVANSSRTRSLNRIDFANLHQRPAHHRRRNHRTRPGLETLQARASSQQIAHMHVDSSKPARWKAAAISTCEFTPCSAARQLSGARQWQ